MIDTIKEIKKKMLSSLKTQRAEIEAKKTQRASEKYTIKRQKVDEENAKLDKAYEEFKTELLANYNKQIAEKAEEVKNKKIQNIKEAKEAAQMEAAAEVNAEIYEFDVEIRKLEKEIN